MGGKVVMHVLLWAAQLFLAAGFAYHGIIKVSPPASLPDPLRWVYDLPPGLRTFIGAAELLGAAGLVLPGLVRVGRVLTPLAATGIAVIMVLAAAFHLRRGEIPLVGVNLALLALAVFVAYGRWRLRPL
jgi:uncharacterized membrane protein YphA (DoxX/SURF4 family)